MKLSDITLLAVHRNVWVVYYHCTPFAIAKQFHDLSWLVVRDQKRFLHDKLNYALLDMFLHESLK